MAIAARKLSADLDLDSTIGGDQLLTNLSLFKDNFEGLLRHIEEKAKQIQTDLIDGIELFDQNYSNTTGELGDKAQDIWQKLYQEKTNMLWSKEEYLNEMHTY
jgi:hypothetical protein